MKKINHNSQMKLKGNILILTFWSYKDALVQTYTLPYVNIIRNIIDKQRKIFIVTFEQEKFEFKENERRVIEDNLRKQNIYLVSFSYKRFGVKKLIAAVSHLISMIKLTKKEKISIIHAFGPNAGGFGFLLSKITGHDLIIDSYEPHAECMMESGEWSRYGPAYNILLKFEKLETRHASYLIGTTAAMKDYAKSKYKITPQNFLVKPACIDFTHFYPRAKDEGLVKELGLENKIVCVYAGKLGGTYLKDEVFDFVESCYLYWKQNFKFLMLTSEDRAEVKRMVQKHDIPEGIVITKYVEHKEIPKYLSLGDFGINPQVPVPSKRYGTPIKNGEYWGMGLPVIISPNISDDSDVIEKNDIGVVMNFTQKDLYNGAIKKIDSLLKTNQRNELQKKIFNIAQSQRSFSIAYDVYN